MGFFGKKKAKQGESTSSRPSASQEAPPTSADAYPGRQQERRQQALKTLPYPSKSVRFASGTLPVYTSF